MPAFAKGNGKGNTGSIWTTRDDCGDIKQDVNHYAIGEHIYINGANFDPGDYFWKIKGQPGGASCDPNIIVAMGTFTVDETGSFCFDAYTVQPDDCGEYKVKFANKGDNYRVKEEVNITCENHTDESSCEEDPNCDWCPLCQYFTRPTKVNQWLQAKCVPEGTDCGWYCEIDYCDATCSLDTDCECPQDECIGNDYYDYPDYGYCVDCPISCYCEIGTEESQPCEPTINYSDPRCGECQDDEDCDYLDRDYCEGDLLKHDEGICIDYSCQVENTTIEDCSDNNYEDCQDTYFKHYYTESCYEDQGEAQCLPASSLIDCRDEYWCNGEEYCSEESGVHCEEGTPVNCDDSDECTIDTCDEDNDECVHTPVSDVLTPPNKTIDEPKAECEETEWCDYKITVLTPITLSCEVGDVKWRYALDGEWNEWNTNTSPVTIYFPEECNHTLEAYCINECGESERDIEYFKVEGTVFEIPLYKKWNLISVPFVLLDDDPEVVFNKAEDIESVWTYDPLKDMCDSGQPENWCVWSSNPAPDNLEEIVPGWGYWVLTNNDTLLIIGGSLFSPATTPPSKELVGGWNLIGYYGTEFYGADWEEEFLDSYDSCGFYHKYGNYVYCKLSSLIDTQEGYPRWSSLMGYDNCGNSTTYWVALDVCDNMHAGKGYWIEIDVEDLYVPATVCLWNKEFNCSL